MKEKIIEILKTVTEENADVKCREINSIMQQEYDDIKRQVTKDIPPGAMEELELLKMRRTIPRVEMSMLMEKYDGCYAVQNALLRIYGKINDIGIECCDPYFRMKEFDECDYVFDHYSIPEDTEKIISILSKKE